jgi:hypothetical protein
LTTFSFLRSADSSPVTDPPVVQENNVAFQDTETTDTTIAPTGVMTLFDSFATTSLPAAIAPLMRPFQVADFEWRSDQAAGTRLLQLNFPDAFLGGLDALGFAYCRDKVRNFAQMRHGVDVTLRLNGNKFLYGALAAVWEPAVHVSGVYSGASPLSDSAFIADTSLHHELVFLNAATAPTLSCKYHSPDPYFRTRGFKPGCVGQLRIWVAAALRSVQATAAGSVHVSVYATMTDVSLLLGTNDSVVASG